LNRTWLGGPLTILSSAEPPVPLGPGTKHTCLILTADCGGGLPPLGVGNGKVVHIYGVNTLYTEERDYEKKHGLDKLFKLLAKNGVTNLTNPKRKCAVEARRKAPQKPVRPKRRRAKA
jgi:hypothetical protein